MMTYSVNISRGNRIEFDVCLSGKKYTIYFLSDDRELSLCAETLIASLLYPCMASDNALVIKEDCDEKFLRHVGTIKSIAGDWFGGSRKISVSAEALHAKAAASQHGAASFFSGGLDSFYTLLNNIEFITDIIFVHGFDVELEDATTRKLCSDLVRKVAAHYGKRVIEVETNIREILDDYIGWGFAHGAAMAAVMHALSSSIGRIYIASSYSYGQLFSWGSHPLLDPLWSSNTLDVIHHGCDATRIEKACFVGGDEFALRSLRVCWKNPGEKSNCGICEKCIRTMLNFEAVGTRGYQQSFPVFLTNKLILSIPELRETSRIFALENLNALRNSENHHDMAEALESLINRPRWVSALIKYGRRRKRKWLRVLDKLHRKSATINSANIAR